MNDMIRMYSWLAAVLMFVSSCGERTVMLHGGSYEEEMYVDSLAAFFSQYSAAGSNDSVILTAGPMMREAAAEGDTLKMLCACVFAAQSWLFADNADSVKYYIDVARTYIRNCSSPLLNVVYCNVYGCYSLRAGLDYTLALNYYLDGLRWAEISGNAGHQTVMLLNIANIFYMQRNAEGYMYAERAQFGGNSLRGRDRYAGCQRKDAGHQIEDINTCIVWTGRLEPQSAGFLYKF